MGLHGVLISALFFWGSLTIPDKMDPKDHLVHRDACTEGKVKQIAEKDLAMVTELPRGRGGLSLRCPAPKTPSLFSCSTYLPLNLFHDSQRSSLTPFLGHAGGQF